MKSIERDFGSKCKLMLTIFVCVSLNHWSHTNPPSENDWKALHCKEFCFKISQNTRQNGNQTVDTELRGIMHTS